MEFKREKYLKQLKDGMSSPLIKVVTGIRRCGKSYLLFTLFVNYLRSIGVDEEHIIRIQLDSLEFAEQRDALALYKEIKSRIKDGGQYYVLLDEIQYVKDFEDVLNSLLHIENADTYVTGSNSKFLSSDIITEFRGRSDEIRLQPLSFKEYFEGLGGDKHDRLDEYMRFGGLPIVALMNEPGKKIAYLKNVFERIYLSDLRQRHNIRNRAEFDELLDVLASGIGTLTNPKKLSSTFRSKNRSAISSNTIRSYIDYYTDSFLISQAKRYDVKGRKYISTPSKYYFADMGLRNARLDFRQIEPTHIMENIIYNELLSRGYQVDVGVVNTYMLNENGNSVTKQLEVDFVVNKGYDRYYIQSAYSYSDEARKEQETASLRNIGDSFERIIITGDSNMTYRDDNGYRIVGLMDFLLGSEEI